MAGVFSATIVPTAGAVTPINTNTGDHIEVQNYTSIQLAKNFIRLGGRLRTSGESISSNGGINGSLSYSYLLDPCTDPSITSKPTNCLTTATTPCSTANVTAGSPVYSSYQCSVPFQFNQTTINKLSISARETDIGIYAEDDWKAKNNLTISYGVRMEAQNYISSTHDFAPRTSIAYGVPRKSGKTITVLRAGGGIFYNRFSLGSIASIVQNNPNNQTDQIFTSPSTACTPAGVTSPSTPGACNPAGSGVTGGKSTIPIAGPGLRAPYVIQGAATIEQALGKYVNVTGTYLHSQGLHQFLTRQFLDSSNYCGTSPATTGYVQCMESEGVFRQNQLIFSTNISTPKGITFFGNYSANWANSNISNILNPTSSSADYGRAGFAVRSQLNFGGNIPLPYHISASPLIFARSGSPYNVFTGVDENDDSLTNDRPAFQPGTSKAVCTQASSFYTPPKQTSFSYGENYTPIPVNYCTGPANVTISLRLGRTFGFGPRTDAGRAGGGGGRGGGGGAAGGFAGIGGGGGAGGGGARGGGGGGGGRGGGGGGGGRGTSTGRKYNLTIAAQAQNLFNEIPYGTPTSTLTSALFGKPTTLMGMPFASANAVRRITLSANFFF